MGQTSPRTEHCWEAWSCGSSCSYAGSQELAAPKLLMSSISLGICCILSSPSLNPDLS